MWLIEALVRQGEGHSVSKTDTSSPSQGDCASSGAPAEMNTQQHSTRVKAPAFPRVRGGTAPSRRNQASSPVPNASPELMTDATQTSIGDGRALTTAHPRMHKSCTSNSRNSMDIRSGIRIATWNVLTLGHTGYVTALVRSLKLSRITLAGITEARLTGSGSTVVEGATVLHSGGQTHVHGVALVVRRPLMDHLVKWAPISDRVLSARFTHRHGHLSVIVVYSPTEDAAEEEKDRFYADLESATLSVRPHDQLIILGDLNAVTGTDRVGFESVVGDFGSGIVNDNSTRLLSYCASNGLSAMGSWFKRKNIHRWTWYSNDGKTIKEIDHIITRQRDKGLLKSYKIYRGSEAPASTDHRLLVATIKLEVPYVKFNPALSKRLNIDRLRTEAKLSETYSVEVRNRFDALGDMGGDDVESVWSRLSGAIVGAATDVVGSQRRKKQPWLTDSTFHVLEQKAEARIRGLVAERRRLRGVFKACAKLDRESYINDLADEAEIGLRKSDLRHAHRAIRSLTGKDGSTPVVPVQRKDGTPCSSLDEILERWKEHFESALNFPPGALCKGLIDLAEISPRDTRIDAEEPSLAEIRRAIMKLKRGRAAGLDSIAPEMLLCAIGPVSCGLHTLFRKVWEVGRVPADWRDGVIVPLYKGKGSRSTCGSYRPISLLSVPGKVLGHVLLNRLSPVLTERRRREQSGFTAGRSTADAILSLRLLSELHYEFNRPLHVAYVDLKSAFDSVDRSALWLTLRAAGVPDTLIGLLRDLHTDTGARVRVGSKMTERFSTSSGVRQGCVLAPALFCLAIDWIMSSMDDLKGIEVGGSSFTDLDYADDIALPVAEATQLGPCLASFSQAARTMGLNVSWPKTKVQCLGRTEQLSEVVVNGERVESVDNFCYLGSILDSSGRCKPDMVHRIGIAASTMNTLARVWSQKRLSLPTKIRVYQTCVLPVLLYGSETWTATSIDAKHLQAFHMRCQRRIMGVRWEDKVRNTIITETTKLPPIEKLLQSRRDALFGHVARLDDRTPAHQALTLSIDARLGRPPSPSWRRPRGRPRDTWLTPLLKSGVPLRAHWNEAVVRGHGLLAQRPSSDTR